MIVHQRSGADDFAERRAGGRDLDFLDDRLAAGLIDELLAEAVFPAAAVADGPQAAGGRVDLGFEEFVADAVAGRRALTALRISDSAVASPARRCD